jgi:hypothetical protein
MPFKRLVLNSRKLRLHYRASSVNATVYSENNIKSIYKLCGQNVEFFTLQHVVHRVTTVPYRVNQPRRQIGNVAGLTVQYR